MSLPLDVYTIQNKAGNTFADLNGGNPGNGTSVTGFQDGSNRVDAFNQRWFISPIDGKPGVYVVVNLRGGSVLDLDNGSSGNGTAIQGWQFNPNAGDQQWRIFKAEIDGFWRLQNVASGTYMDLAGGSPNDGNKIQGWQHVNNDNQLWTLRAVTTRGSQINAALKVNQFIKQEFPRYLQDDIYISIPDAILNEIYAGLAGGFSSTRVVNMDGFAYAVKAAVSKWNSDFIRTDNLPFVFGIVFGQDANGLGHAQNWLMSEDGNGIVFFDPTTGSRTSNPGIQAYFGVY